MKFYIEKVLDKAGKETGEIHILKFRDGRIIPAPYSRVSLGSGVSGFVARLPQMVYINQLTFLGYSANEAKCRSDIQARLSEAFEGRNGTQKLADEHRKLLLEYNDGFINEIEIDVSYWTTLAGGFKELVEAFEAQLATDYRNKVAKEKSAAEAGVQGNRLNKDMGNRATTVMAALATAAAAAARDDAALSTDSLPPLRAVPPTAASAAAAGPSAPVVAATPTATDTTTTPTARVSVT